MSIMLKEILMCPPVYAKSNINNNLQILAVRLIHSESPTLICLLGDNDWPHTIGGVSENSRTVIDVTAR
jgi:hypothetical protein